MHMYAGTNEVEASQMAAAGRCQALCYQLKTLPIF